MLNNQRENVYYIINYISVVFYLGEPDVSSYSYDETSGYFFDQHTGLYYDAASQYYYHSQDQIFLYWDSEKRAYMPAPTDDKSGNQCKTATEEANKDEKKKDKDKDKNQDKVKVAKRIAKVIIVLRKKG